MKFLNITAYCDLCQIYVKYGFSDSEQFVMNIPDRDQRQKAIIRIKCRSCDNLIASLTGEV